MSRHPFPEEPYLTGENYFPINGGLLIESGQKFLSIFPNFPLGAGMPDQEHFELHLHRNPDESDGLGISGYYGEYSPAEHVFSIGFSDLEPQQVWRDYLENKASPLVFFIQKQELLTENFEFADKISDKWEGKLEFELARDDECGYISSVVKRDQDTIARILNICNETVYPEIKGYKIGKELNAIGGQKEKRQTVVEKGVLEFEINDNSARNFVKYPNDFELIGVNPFHLNTYLLEREDN